MIDSILPLLEQDLSPMNNPCSNTPARLLSYIESYKLATTSDGSGARGPDLPDNMLLSLQSPSSFPNA